jgi:glycosyltransferase involved in cell wall biosynthesis
MASALGLTGAVQFLGHLDHPALEHALAAAWVQAIPSRWEEPFGLVAAEAMMRGTAAVASDAGGLAEQVVQGETGYRVAPGDPHALAGALTRVLADRDHAERLGARGRSHALAYFTFATYMDGLLHILETAAASARPAAVARTQDARLS